MSTPPFDPDDPRLTAYALGEANDPDQQAVETILAASAEARAEVEQTRAFARTLAAEYARENELYRPSLPDAGSPSNIIAFGSARGRLWQRTTALALKAAAVLMAASSLVYLTVRRPHPPQTAAVASATPIGSGQVFMPTPVAAEQPAKDAIAVARDEDSFESAKPTFASVQEDPTTVSATPRVNSDTLVAMETPEGADDARPSARARTSEQPPAPVAAQPATRRDNATALPGSASATVTTVPQPSPTILPDERIARSLVRIRTAAGAYFGGVLVSSEGLILSAPRMPDGAIRQGCTVQLADQRELPAVADTAKSSAGWSSWRVNASGLPAVALASSAPPTNSALVLAVVDPQTGATTFSHTRADELDASSLDQTDGSGPVPLMGDTGSRTAFAFNSAGELLVAEAAQPQAAAKVKVASSRSVRKKSLVRPFTPVERATLR